MRAGRRRRYRFEPDTFHWRVDDALYVLAEGIKEFVDGSDTPSSRGGQGLADEDGDAGEARRAVARRAAARRRATVGRPGVRTARRKARGA